MWRPEDWWNSYLINGFDEKGKVLEEGADMILRSLSKLPMCGIVRIIDNIRQEELEDG